ncbi:MAG: alpha/beta hydrolase [Planctomycetota bacterium]
MHRLFFAIYFVAWFLLVLSPAPAWAYDYPFEDPYVATVVGTPPQYQMVVPKKVPVRTYKLEVFPQREIPRVFWYQKKLRYSLVYQKNKAPLIFNIAGTGASFDSAKMQFMSKVFYQAGFHVISLSSPTVSNFIVNASSTKIPGLLSVDAADLYRVMELAYEQVRKRVEVSEFYLTGYSLGGSQAAFVAKLDEEQKIFNFKKVLLINPPVSLFKSVSILDKMLIDGIPGGMSGFNDYFNDLFEKFAETYRDHDFLQFDEQFLHSVYKLRRPKGPKLAPLIGLSFRLSSSSMMFTSDVMSHFGLVVPKNRDLSSSDSLTLYFKVTVRISFVDYFNEMFFPYYNSRDPQATKQSLMDQTSLKSIEPYLRDSQKIGVIHNEDDLILAPGEIEFFRRVFQARAKIYSKGGHCGNMEFSDNATYMVNFFAN